MNIELAFLNVCGLIFLLCVGLGIVVAIISFAEHIQFLGDRIRVLEKRASDKDYKEKK